MRQAVLTGTMTALAAGLVGYFVQLRQLVFASDALRDLTFPAGMLALLLGIDLRLGLFGITALLAVAMGLLGQRVWGREIVAGTVLAWGSGIGALLLSLYASSANSRYGAAGVTILFGTIFSLDRRQSSFVCLMTFLVITLLLIVARPLLGASLLPEVAAARGIPVRALNLIFLSLLAVTIAAAVPTTGSLIVFALLITPAAIAQRLTSRPFQGLALSAGIAVSCTWVGLVVGFVTPYPVSFLIAATAFALYLGAILYSASLTTFRLRSRGRDRHSADKRQ